MHTLIDRIMNKVGTACKNWADVEAESEGFTLYPNDGGVPVFFGIGHAADGLESFAEASLRHEDKKFRDTARKIQREQFSQIKLNNKLVSSIVQFGVFGEEIF